MATVGAAPNGRYFSPLVPSVGRFREDDAEPFHRSEIFPAAAFAASTLASELAGPSLSNAARPDTSGHTSREATVLLSPSSSIASQSNGSDLLPPRSHLAKNISTQNFTRPARVLPTSFAASSKRAKVVTEKRIGIGLVGGFGGIYCK